MWHPPLDAPVLPETGGDAVNKDLYRRDFATDPVDYQSETSGYAVRLIAEINEVLRECIHEGMVPVGVRFINSTDSLAFFSVTAVKCEIPDNLWKAVTP